MGCDLNLVFRFIPSFFCKFGLILEQTKTTSSKDSKAKKQGVWVTMQGPPCFSCARKSGWQDQKTVMGCHFQRLQTLSLEYTSQGVCVLLCPIYWKKETLAILRTNISTSKVEKKMTFHIYSSEILMSNFPFQKMVPTLQKTAETKSTEEDLLLSFGHGSVYSQCHPAGCHRGRHSVRMAQGKS